MKSQVVFGTEFRGQLPLDFQHYFDRRDLPVLRSVEVEFRTVTKLPPMEEIWVEQHQQASVCSRYALFNVPDGVGLSVQCQGSGTFRIYQNKITIEWLPDGTGAAHYFFSYCVPLWLESLGVPVLHASAVTIDGYSVAFLGKSGMGKSSMAASLGKLGCALIVDDGLPVFESTDGTWQCQPGPPMFKLWPESLVQLEKDGAESLERVHQLYEKRIVRNSSTTRADKRDLTLAAIFILERSGNASDTIRIESAGNAAAPIKLIEHSLAGGPASALGLSTRRFEQLVRLARMVPVRILHYPGSFDNAPRILRALKADLDRRPLQGDALSNGC